MDDYIERKKILDFCNQVTNRDIDGDNDIVKAFRAFAEYVKALPSAQPEQRWIPVTERLPNGFQTCIVTDELRQCSYEYDYNPDNEFTKRYGWRYNGRKIIAWMPLPEVWKEGEQE